MGAEILVPVWWRRCRRCQSDEALVLGVAFWVGGGQVGLRGHAFWVDAREVQWVRRLASF